MAFSQQMVENFKEAFSLFDKKGQGAPRVQLFSHHDAVPGVIDTASLGLVMRAIGLEPSDAELKNMITEVDGSGKGAVVFAEARNAGCKPSLTAGSS